MIDLVFLYLKAGDGGHGRVSFRREKFVSKGGPDGGSGGRGGDLVLKASPHLATLEHLAGVKTVVAQAGQMGGKRQRTGANGKNTTIEVPVGTIIWELSKFSSEVGGRTSRALLYRLEKVGQAVPRRGDEIKLNSLNPEQLSFAALRKSNFAAQSRLELGRLTQSGQEIVICHGGAGGRGNVTFKGPTNTTPLEAEYGQVGEVHVIALELQLLADVGLVGLPNAGKSTILGRLTKATPKVATYPFTTLAPHLGLMRTTGQEIVLADIPGLIAGASRGKGLGYQFLRHIKGCKVLWYVLFLEEGIAFDRSLPLAKKAEHVWQQYQTLRRELRTFDPVLLDRPVVVTLNKSDLYAPELQRAIVKCLAQEKVELWPMSAATGAGLPIVTNELSSMVVKQVKDRSAQVEKRSPAEER